MEERLNMPLRTSAGEPADAKWFKKFALHPTRIGKAKVWLEYYEISEYWYDSVEDDICWATRTIAK